MRINLKGVRAAVLFALLLALASVSIPEARGHNLYSETCVNRVSFPGPFRRTVHRSDCAIRGPVEHQHEETTPDENPDPSEGE